MSAAADPAGVSLSGVMDENRRACRAAGPQLPPRMPALMVALTAVTGVVEAVSLLALGPAFTAMQTGNVLFLAFGAAGAGRLETLAPGISLAAFVVGVVTGSHLESVAEVRGRRWFVIGLVVEAGLILVAAAVGWGLTAQYGPRPHAIWRRRRPWPWPWGCATPPSCGRTCRACRRRWSPAR